MKVLLCLCAWIAAATAHGVVSYPLTPIGYTGTYLPPFTTITRPLGVTYTGLQSYPLPYFSYNIIPNNVLFAGVPGLPSLVQIVPLGPDNGKGKPDKKKPGEKGKDDKNKKEDTTEEPKKDEEADSKTDATEDLSR